MNTKKINMIVLLILAGIITVGFFSLLFLLVLYEVPEKNGTLLNITVGALISAFSGGVVGYFFGSSAGSAAKTDIMSDEMSKIKNNNETLTK